MFKKRNVQETIFLFILCFHLFEKINSSVTYDYIEDELTEFENQGNDWKDSEHFYPKTLKNTINSEMINDELMGNTWNYMAELVLILLLSVLTIPANIFLFFFYTKKIYQYKKFQSPKTNKVRSSSIKNSFNTYMIEICLFDSLIVVYLVSNTLFQFFFYLKKTQYESIFDVSNFACKFFIYVLRISGAMSNYLVLLLALNRCMLLHFK